jgi:hypothetical protein
MSTLVLRAHPASYSMGTTFLSWGLSSQGVNLNTHLHAVPGLKMSEVILLLPLYTIRAWTVKTLPLPFENVT